MASLPWVEKYRPKRLQDLVYQDKVRDMLQAYVHKPHLPHLLFYGPPGTGKTSAILAYASNLYGPDYRQERVYELNASHERDINTIREKVKAFANIFVTSHPSKEYPCPAYKIIILDEADAMTAEAQRALRRIMETTTQQTRFCLICNYASKIIDPIASRCTPMRFKPIPPSVMAKRLSAICKREAFQLNTSALHTLLTFSGGDFRIALNIMQSLWSRYRTNAKSLEVLSKNPTTFFRTLFGLATPSDVAAFGQVCLSQEASACVRRDAVDALLCEGYDVGTLLRQLQSYFVQYLDESHLTVVLDALANCEYCCVQGANVRIQLLHLVFNLFSASHFDFVLQGERVKHVDT